MTTVTEDEAALTSAAEDSGVQSLLDAVAEARAGLVWGDRVRFERQLRCWTQPQLARIAGVTQPQVSRIENGAVAVTHATLSRIARALTIPGAELFPFEDVASEEPPAAAAG